MIEEYEQAHDVPAIEVAAALAKMFRGDVPLLLKPEPKRERPQSFDERHERSERPQRAPRHEREEGGERSFRERPAFPKKERVARNPDAGMNTIEQTAMFLPTLWVATMFGDARIAAWLGYTWLAARLWFLFGYLSEAGRRSPGFTIASLANLALLGIAFWGLLPSLLRIG